MLSPIEQVGKLSPERGCSLEREQPPPLRLSPMVALALNRPHPCPDPSSYERYIGRSDDG